MTTPTDPSQSPSPTAHRTDSPSLQGGGQGVGPDPPATYAAAGVDIAAWEETYGRIKGAIRSTFGPQVVGDIGGFGGLYTAPRGDRPVLVSSVDSVGTKVRVAIGLRRHDTVGHDIVNHCVNDILCGGARPLFFLDYIGTSHLDPPTIEAIVTGLAAACRANRVALIGGETAELPGMYAEGDYDLVGCIVGVVEHDRIVDGAAIAPGDVLLGLPSSGLHTNGYSLARRLLPPEQWGLPLPRGEGWGEGLHDPMPTEPPSSRTIGDALLAPHRSYLDDIERLDQVIAIKGMAHITGGGLRDNIVRVLPPHTRADLRFGSWHVPPIFPLIQQAGDVSLAEMCHVFNMGVGYVVVCPADDVNAAQAAVPTTVPIGEVHASAGSAVVRVVDAAGGIICTSESNAG